MATIYPVPDNYPQEIIGYAEPWIVDPGEEVAIKISCTEPEYKFHTLHIVQGYQDEKSPPRLVNEVTEIPRGVQSGRFQLAHPGSYADLPPLSFRETDTGSRVTLYAQPWLVPCAHVQAIISTLDVTACTGFAIVLDETGAFQIWVGTGEEVEVLSTEFIVEKRRWLHIILDIVDCTVRLKVVESEEGLVPAGRTFDQTFEIGLSASVCESSRILLAASHALSSTSRTPHGVPGNHYNGRLEAVTFETLGPETPRLLALYDFSRGISSDTVVDVISNDKRGTLYNAPTRAVRGYNWPGTEVDWTKDSRHYGAIHFHDDDLDDCQWQTDFIITIPVNVRSGVYAVEVESTSSNVRDTIPFFVRPSNNTPSHSPKVALVASTFTYLAYANEHMWDPNSPARAEVPDTFGSFEFYKDETFHKQVRRKDLGLSCYDVHSDGSGVVFSSSKRPLLNHRPDYVNWTGHRPRELSAELIMIGYLERLGIACDILTDHDLHTFGSSALSRYKVILTGCHPEYPTLQSYKAYQSYLHNGGKLMYLGGNGFYWSSALSLANPHRLEVRRGGQGVRTSYQEPGERHHSTDGTIGGLWRDRGKAANYLVGIGCCGEGAGPGVEYRVTSDLVEKAPKLFTKVFGGLKFEGSKDFTFGHDTLGGFGGGASADEIDRVDIEYGSPRNIVVLASSTGHSDRFGLFCEDAHFPMINTLGTQTDLIRSDMTYHETAGGGAVFSVGSISWYVALGFENYENDVARITANVLRMFLNDETGEGRKSSKS